MFTCREEGKEDTHEYRIQACDPTTRSALSLWHNVPVREAEPYTALSLFQNFA